MKEQRKEWISLLGGFITLTGFFLPFEPERPLFEILENSPLPYFSLLLVLMTVLAMVLQTRKPFVAKLLVLFLLLGWLGLFLLILWVFTPEVLGEMGLGAFLIPLGLVMSLV